MTSSTLHNHHAATGGRSVDELYAEVRRLTRLCERQERTLDSLVMAFDSVRRGTLDLKAENDGLRAELAHARNARPAIRASAPSARLVRP